MAILENQSPVTLNGLIERFRQVLDTTRIPLHNGLVANRWALMDCAKDIHHYYPRTGLDIAAQSLPYNRTTLQDYVYFAECFPASQVEERRAIGRLPYSLVRNAIRASRRAPESPQNNPQWWIRRAQKNHWTSKQLEEDVQKYYGRRQFRHSKENDVQQPSSAISVDDLIAQFHATWNNGHYEERRWHQIDLVKQIVDLSGQDGLLRLGNSEDLEMSTLRNYSLVGQALTPELRQQFPQLKYANALEAVLAARRFPHPPHNSVRWWLEQAEQQHWNLRDIRQAINQAIAEGRAEGQAMQSGQSSCHSLADLITQFQQVRVAETPANLETNRWEQMALALQIFELYGHLGIKQLADVTQLSMTTLRNYRVIRQTITPEVIQHYGQFNYSIMVEAVLASHRFSQAPKNSVIWWLEQAKQHQWGSKELYKTSMDMKKMDGNPRTIIEQSTFLEPAMVTTEVVNYTEPLDQASRISEQRKESGEQSHQIPLAQDTVSSKRLVSEMGRADKVSENLDQPVLFSDPRMNHAIHVAQTKLQQADQELMTLQELIDEFNHHLAPFLGEAVELVRRPVE